MLPVYDSEVDQFNPQPSYALGAPGPDRLGVKPLYHSQPQQRPFINEGNQYEWRWVVEITMQVNQIVTVPMEFADTLDVDPVSVEAAFPA